MTNLNPEGPSIKESVLGNVIDYELGFFNLNVAFIIDDHHMPFSAAPDGNHIADMMFGQDEHYYNGHAFHRFKLKNTATGEDRIFTIVICPFAAQFDHDYWRMLSLMLAQTIDTGKSAIHYGNKRGAFMLVSRSMFSVKEEARKTIPGEEVEKMMINTGSGYIQWTSKLTALFQMVQDTMQMDKNQLLQFQMKECFLCQRIKAMGLLQ